MRVARFVAVVAGVEAFNYAEHLSTKGPYGINSSNAEVARMGSCKLQQVQMFIRHGTRYPSRGDILAFDELTTLLNTTQPFLLSNAGLLAPQGELEMYRMGKRLQSRYPNALATTNYFQSSDVERTSQSLSALAIGLYEGQGIISSAHIQPISIVRAEPRDNDRLISMKYACPMYTAIQERDEQARNELSLFLRRRIEPIRKRLSSILGKKLTIRMADSIYRLCAFYTSHQIDNKQWCDLLTEQDFLHFEFFNDIDDFYAHAYGHKLNTQLGCALLNDIKSSMREATSRMRIFLGHAEGVMLLLSHLGVMKDESSLYRGNASDEEIKRHQFRTSNVSFSANIAFELWECQDTQRVRVILNENQIIKEVNLQEFTERQSFRCDWDELCHVYTLSQGVPDRMKIQIP